MLGKRGPPRQARDAGRQHDSIGSLERPHRGAAAHAGGGQRRECGLALLAGAAAGPIHFDSIVLGTRWTARAKPHPEIAEVAAAQVRQFLEGLYRAGAFGTRSMEDAFFVVADQRINSAESGGDFQLVLGFAANREHEFHSFRISQSVRGAKVQPVSLNRLNFSQYSPAELEWVDSIATQLQS